MYVLIFTIMNPLKLLYNYEPPKIKNRDKKLRCFIKPILIARKLSVTDLTKTQIEKIVPAAVLFLTCNCTVKFEKFTNLLLKYRFTVSLTRLTKNLILVLKNLKTCKNIYHPHFKLCNECIECIYNWSFY